MTSIPQKEDSVEDLIKIFENFVNPDFVKNNTESRSFIDGHVFVLKKDLYLSKLGLFVIESVLINDKLKTILIVKPQQKIEIANAVDGVYFRPRNLNGRRSFILSLGTEQFRKMVERFF